jgi:hypothetical protein
MMPCTIKMKRIGAFFAFGLLGIRALAQDPDVVQVWAFGGPQEDRGTRITLLEEGDILLSGTTNSTSVSENHAWLLRLNSSGQTLWSTTVEDAPLLQAVDAVEHNNGNLTLLGMRYANPADGYDWGWYHLASDGELISTTTWGSPQWDLPLRCWNRNETLWTLGTSYNSGNGDVLWMQHVQDDNEEWVFSDSGLVFATESEEVATDGLWVGDTLVVASTSVTSNRALINAVLPASEELIWSYESSWDDATEAVAMDVGESGILLLMNVSTEDGSRLAFAHFSLDGTLLLEYIPGSGFNIQGRSIHWYNANDFATVASTEELGAGGEEVLFSRWSSNNGAWLGGPSFGSPGDDSVSHLERDASGRFWVLGRSNGYSNGRDDFYLLRLPNAEIGEYVFDEEIIVGDSALSLPLQDAQKPLQIAPNPATSFVEVIGWGFRDSWQLLDSNGRLICSGEGPTVNVMGLESGTYFWVGHASGAQHSIRTEAIHVIR